MVIDIAGIPAFFSLQQKIDGEALSTSLICNYKEIKSY